MKVHRRALKETLLTESAGKRRLLCVFAHMIMHSILVLLRYATRGANEETLIIANILQAYNGSNNGSGNSGNRHFAQTWIDLRTSYLHRDVFNFSSRGGQNLLRKLASVKPLNPFLTIFK
jgi:hypothetical protein